MQTRHYILEAFGFVPTGAEVMDAHTFVLHDTFKVNLTSKNINNLAMYRGIAQRNIMGIITDLKNSPMFHLSLSSKELFHSNLLAWLAEDPDTKDLFVEVLKLFDLEDLRAIDLADGIRNDTYMVLREYKNFDFCICEKLRNWKEKADEEEFVPGSECGVV